MSLSSATEDVRGRAEKLCTGIPQQIAQSGLIDALVDAIAAGASEEAQRLIVALYLQNAEELADEFAEAVQIGEGIAVGRIRDL